MTTSEEEPKQKNPTDLLNDQVNLLEEIKTLNSQVRDELLLFNETNEEILGFLERPNPRGVRLIDIDIQFMHLANIIFKILFATLLAAIPIGIVVGFCWFIVMLSTGF